MPPILRSLRIDFIKALHSKGRLFSSSLESNAFVDLCNPEGQNVSAPPAKAVPSFIVPIGSKLQELYHETRKLADQIATCTHFQVKYTAADYDNKCLASNIDLNDEPCNIQSRHDEKSSDETLKWFSEHISNLHQRNNIHAIDHANSHGAFGYSYLDAQILENVLHQTSRQRSVSTGVNSTRDFSKADCDTILANNTISSLTQADFYDDNIISRTSYEIDMFTHRPGHLALAPELPYIADLQNYTLQNSAMQITQKTGPRNSKELCEGRLQGGGQEQNEKSPDPSPNKPNMDQLRLIQDHMVDYMPQFFIAKHDYRVYSQDVVFENNMATTPYTTSGLSAYVIEIAKLRMYGIARFASVKFQVLSSSVNEVQGTVQIRWRVSGIPQAKAFMFWKFLPWKYFLRRNRSKKWEEESVWEDGLSTLHVDKDGFIFRHVLDKMELDNEPSVKGKKISPAFAAKLAKLANPGVASSP